MEADARDPTDEADDDMYERSPGPTPNKLRKEVIEHGDVEFSLATVRIKRLSEKQVGRKMM